METTATVSIILTVLFGLLSVVFYFRSRRHKRLTFTSHRCQTDSQLGGLQSA
jgi:hypothetical protein